MHSLGGYYGVVFKMPIPFVVTAFPVNQLLLLIFGSKFINFTLPWQESVFAVHNNPLYLGEVEVYVRGAGILLIYKIFTFCMQKMRKKYILSKQR